MNANTVADITSNRGLSKELLSLNTQSVVGRFQRLSMDNHRCITRNCFRQQKSIRGLKHVKNATRKLQPIEVSPHGPGRQQLSCYLKPFHPIGRNKHSRSKRSHSKQMEPAQRIMDHYLANTWQSVQPGESNCYGFLTFPYLAEKDCCAKTGSSSQKPPVSSCCCPPSETVNPV